MGNRLSYEIVAPDELRAHPFPPALLITIVENAITHGIEPQAQGGSIRIEALRAGDNLVVRVSDTGRGLSAGAATAGNGVGLANVRERLAALFGSRGRFIAGRHHTAWGPRDDRDTLCHRLNGMTPVLAFVRQSRLPLRGPSLRLS